MKLILLVNGNENKLLADLLINAAEQYQLPVIIQDISDNLPKLDTNEQYLLYSNIAKNLKKSRKIEAYLYHTYNCVSLYQTYNKSKLSARNKLNLANIPYPKSSYIKNSNVEHILQQVDIVGGFPIILRATDKKWMGIGVMKFDTINSLQDMVKAIMQKDSATWLCIQQYIPHDHHLRLIVLGEEVISTTAEYKETIDFRTNRKPAKGKDNIIKAISCSDEIKQLAIRTAHILETNYGGVDIILDDKGNPYVLEINTPCGFHRTQKATGVPIASKIIEYLIDKAKKSVPKITKPIKDNVELLILNNNPNHPSVSLLEKQAKLNQIPYRKIRSQEQIEQLPHDKIYMVHKMHFSQKSFNYLIKNYRYVALSLFNLSWKNDRTIQKRLKNNDIKALKLTTIRNTDINYLSEKFKSFNGSPVLIKMSDKKSNNYLYADDFHSFASQIDYASLLKKKITVQKHIESEKYGGAVIINGKVVSNFQYLQMESNVSNLASDNIMIKNHVSKDEFDAIHRVIKSIPDDHFAIEYIVSKQGDFILTNVVSNILFSCFQQFSDNDIARLIIDSLIISANNYEQRMVS